MACLSLKTLKFGSVCIAILYMILSVYVITAEAVFALHYGYDIDKSAIFNFIHSGLQFVFSAVLLHGAVKQKTALMLPWLLVNAALIIVMIIALLRVISKYYYAMDVLEVLLPAMASFCYVTAYHQALEKQKGIAKASTLRQVVTQNQEIRYVDTPPSYEEASKYPKP